MKYFLDTEFIEGFHKPLFGKRRHFIDLISIGIVGQDGSEFYAISNEWSYNDANDWVKHYVIHKLPLKLRKNESFGQFDKRCRLRDTYVGKWYEGHSNSWIRDEITCFFSRSHNSNPTEFYGYFADYDWVAFASLFGTMDRLPDGYPYYCRDLKQMMDERALTAKWKDKVCPDPPGEHDALVDALWNKKLYAAIMLEPIPNF